MHTSWSEPLIFTLNITMSAKQNNVYFRPCEEWAESSLTSEEIKKSNEKYQMRGRANNGTF
jgi:hypothetical protein